MSILSNKDKEIVKQQEHRFSYFFDFVAFLKGDLSGANLLFCTGMKIFFNIDGINLSDVKMISELCEQFNIPYKSYNYDKKSLVSSQQLKRMKKKLHWYYRHQQRLYCLMTV